jgi:hypothetical protein
LPNWKGPGYRPDKQAYDERKQAYDKIEPMKRQDSKERKMLVKQIVEDGATVENILDALLLESKQDPQGPWRIVTSRTTHIRTCRTLNDVYEWVTEYENGWSTGYECLLIQFAHIYDNWKLGKYNKVPPPDFIELLFLAFVDESQIRRLGPFDWDYIIIGTSRMLVQQRFAKNIEVEIFCSSCTSETIVRTTEESVYPAECSTCSHNTVRLFHESGGLCIDLARLLHSYIFIENE